MDESINLAAHTLIPGFLELCCYAPSEIDHVSTLFRPRKLVYAAVALAAISAIALCYFQPPIAVTAVVVIVESAVIGASLVNLIAQCNHYFQESRNRICPQ